jgi:hypothetical protein
MFHAQDIRIAKMIVRIIIGGMILAGSITAVHADTAMTVSQLQNLFRDGQANGAISPLDMRNVIVSMLNNQANLGDLTNISAAQTNLGLGTAATINTGTSGSLVPLLSGANTWGALQIFSSGATITSTGTNSASLNMNPASGQAASIVVTGGAGYLFVNTPTATRFSVNGVENLQLDPSDVTINQPMLMNQSGTVATGFLPPIDMNKSYSGSTTTGITYLGELLQSNVDTVNTGAEATNSAIMLGINHIFGGSTLTGNRIDLQINSTLTGGTGNTLASGGTQMASLQMYTTATGNDNGTSAGFATDHGSGVIWSVNTFARLASAATYYGGIVGWEQDIEVDTGASVVDKIGMNVVLEPNDAVQGQRTDAAVLINKGGSGEGNGWRYGIQFGGFNSDWGFLSTSTMIGAVNNTSSAYSMVANNGIDFSQMTFSGNSWNDGHIVMTGAGDLLANSATALATSATAGFLHLPHTTAAPTGTPTNTTPGCEWNTATHTLNCYDGAAWYHFTGTSGAS